jgi:urease accessory protein
MMLLVQGIVGMLDEDRFADRAVERLVVSSGDASKRILRGRTDAGTDVAINLPRGSYLADGTVLHDDGERVVVVERQAEETLILRFADELDRVELMRQAVRLGHAFGNQHVPVELVDAEIRIPITTSREIAADTVHGLHLDGVEVSFGFVPLGRSGPLHPGTHDHHHRQDPSTTPGDAH